AVGSFKIEPAESSYGPPAHQHRTTIVGPRPAKRTPARAASSGSPAPAAPATQAHDEGFEEF
nr:hypothetical protein [Candidatus Eisenbacteria bacterium]